MDRMIHRARQFVLGWSDRGHRGFLPRHNRQCAGRVAHRTNLVASGVKFTLVATTVGARLMIFIHAGRFDQAITFNLMAAAARRHVDTAVLMHRMRKTGLGAGRNGWRRTSERPTILMTGRTLRAGGCERGLAVVTLGLTIVHLRPRQCSFARCR